MKWNVIWKYVFYSMIAGSMVISGCSTSKNIKEASLKNLAPANQSHVAGISGVEQPLDIEKIIQQAESHYNQGYAYYKDRKWDLAKREFDQAIQTLLDADLDVETHYKLGKAYNKLVYNIHKLTLEESLRRSGLLDQSAEEEEATENSLSPTTPDLLTTEAIDAEADHLLRSSGDLLGVIAINEADPDMQKYVKQFAYARSQFRLGMERGAKYFSMIRKIFQAHNLPPELIYLPLIESNFRLDAVSPTGAVGLWQFVQSTAKIYGLRVDKWVDERYDPEKSTIAAAKYLNDLYQMLGCWDLALAGYYMGEYRVHKAIGQYRTRNIATLAGTKSFGWDAKQYVTRFKATVFMTKNLKKYDLDLEDLPPLLYQTAQVRKGELLNDLAERLGVSYQQLRDLNPELRKAITPPGAGAYTLKVPADIAPVILAQNLSPVRQEDTGEKSASTHATAEPRTNADNEKTLAASADVIIHKVKKGDTLAKIAKQYGVDTKTLQQLNHLTRTKTLKIGQQIKVPSVDVASLGGLEVITHTLQKGETLASLAKQYHVDIDTLKAYNNIRDTRKLQIGQKLEVPLSKTSVVANNQLSGKKMVTYRVKRGDSLSKIASAFGVSISQLKEWNKFDDGLLLYPGNRIKVWY